MLPPCFTFHDKVVGGPQRDRLFGMATKQSRSERCGELLGAHLDTNERARLPKRGRIVGRNPEGLGQNQRPSCTAVSPKELRLLLLPWAGTRGAERLVPAIDALLAMRDRWREGSRDGVFGS